MDKAEFLNIKLFRIFFEFKYATVVDLKWMAKGQRNVFCSRICSCNVGTFVCQNSELGCDSLALEKRSYSMNL